MINGERNQRFKTKPARSSEREKRTVYDCLAPIRMYTVTRVTIENMIIPVSIALLRIHWI